jgi:hypothetical protein
LPPFLLVSPVLVLPDESLELVESAGRKAAARSLKTLEIAAIGSAAGWMLTCPQSAACTPLFQIGIAGWEFAYSARH